MSADVHIWDGRPRVTAWCGGTRTAEEAELASQPTYNEVTCPGCLSVRQESQTIARDIGNRVDRQMMWELD
ncbi:hypothetical protein [Streptomyces sp. NPDC048157]|uniref:hypothetical protein n=1 Tax=Streptomyces sp. NPDC048157 TaxID=3365503 RepID=UPI003718C30F